ncbi:MAG: amino acid permease [Solirubrobacterales bacterium]|nr:amino acid permease [Solirubrobacterales bacterium]
MRKLVALPVLSADARSSVAYGPDSMLAVLVLAGGSRLSFRRADLRVHRRDRAAGDRRPHRRGRARVSCAPGATAYNDFPRVMFILARDRFAPRSFLRMGDRLAFNNGIVILSILAALVFVVFAGNTTALILLYAVGVFLAFTLSQAGMVVHRRRVRGPRWRTSMVIGAIRCAMSAIVFLIAGITKFTRSLGVTADRGRVHDRRPHHSATLRSRRSGHRAGRSGDRDAEGEQTPSQLSNLVILSIPALTG